MPDILIGNIRGPQGATGPANTLLASVYQFCASDSGATIPQEGLWTSGVPQIEKGKYIWCRNILTWDSGPETILYSVGYVGNDGDFSGIEIVNELGDRVSVLEDRVTPISKGGTESSTLAGAQAKLGITALQDAIDSLKAVATEAANGLMSKEDKKRLDAINDETTGINLLRGTRDFVPGQSISSINNAYNTDGFKITSAMTFLQKSKDDQGFGVISSTATPITNGATLYGSAVAGLQPGDEVTFTIEYMFDDVSAITETNIAIAYLTSFTGTSQLTNVTAFADKSSIVPGKWTKLVYHYTIPQNFSSTSGILVPGIRLYGANACHVRKAALYRGQINNPVWSASPFDIDYINDETTGINLLRYTRDFTIGTKNYSKNQYLASDGFRVASQPQLQTVKTGSDGFAEWTMQGTGDSNNVVFYSQPLENLAIGTYTVSFEYRIDDAEWLKGNQFVAFAGNSNFAADGISSVAQTILPNNQEIGKWYSYSFTFSILKEMPANAYVYMNTTLKSYNGATGKVSFRRFCINSGKVNHPIWSASPFDVAQTSEVKQLNDTWESAGSIIPSRLTNGYDLNKLFTPGKHYAENTAIATSILNRPEEATSSFVVIVIPTNTDGKQRSGTVAQILIPNIGNRLVIFFRRISADGSVNTGWGSYSFTV